VGRKKVGRRGGIEEGSDRGFGQQIFHQVRGHDADAQAERESVTFLASRFPEFNGHHLSPKMVIGVETVGLVLAVLPLLVNQLDNYTRGIQQIKLLRRYHRTLADYTLKLRTQHTIFLNNLEQALDGVVHDDDQIRDLINDPDGDPWKDPVLQQNLLRKLDRNYEYFLENMSSLHSMILHLAKKLDLDLANQMNVSC
jgi:hypothetical protein